MFIFPANMPVRLWVIVGPLQLWAGQRHNNPIWAHRSIALWGPYLGPRLVPHFGVSHLFLAFLTNIRARSGLLVNCHKKAYIGAPKGKPAGAALGRLYRLSFLKWTENWECSGPTWVLKSMFVGFDLHTVHTQAVFKCTNLDYSILINLAMPCVHGLP